MSPPNKKQRLAARRQAARAQLDRKRAAARARTADLRAKRRWRALLLLVLIFLLLAVCCNCNCEGPPEPAPVPEEPAPVEVVEPVAPPAPITGKIKKKRRPPYQNEAPKPLPWLASFRMQVAARSPRLSECFVGVDRPGTLKWTTAVEPKEGRVADHELEPMLLSAPLTKRERACVLGVLTNPPYKLVTGDEPTTPSRVAMVIEF